MNKSKRNFNDGVRDFFVIGENRKNGERGQGIEISFEMGFQGAFLEEEIARAGALP